MQPPEPAASTASANPPATSPSPRLNALQLEQLAEKIIERMKREVRLDREREGKSR